jgi:hypothetical protein
MIDVNAEAGVDEGDGVASVRKELGCGDELLGRRGLRWFRVAVGEAVMGNGHLGDRRVGVGRNWYVFA